MLTRRVLVPVIVVWAICLVISAIQGEGETSSGFKGFLENLPWLLFLALTLFLIVAGVMALVRRGRQPRSDA